jgi:hypothetical protein
VCVVVAAVLFMPRVTVENHDVLMSRLRFTENGVEVKHAGS